MSHITFFSLLYLASQISAKFQNDIPSTVLEVHIIKE